MPKIIENIREQLLTEAKRQINEYGYENTTVRSVARECGIAVGTVYNYFKSKDMLIASFILKDWLECTGRIAAYPKEDRRSYLAFIHLSLNDFKENHKKIFTDKAAAKVFNIAFSERHVQIREQLANLIEPICDRRFTAEYVAEAMLCWTMVGKTFAEIYPLLPEVIK
jgi:AcrR family transcriptional regulator